MGEFAEDDFVYFPLHKGETFSMVIMSPSGYGKTTILKRIIYYCYKSGYEILCFDNKSNNFADMKKLGNHHRLHPEEFPDKIPVVVYTPEFVIKSLEKYNINFGKKTALHISDLTETSQMQTIGLTATGSLVLQEYLQQFPNMGLRQIISRVRSDRRVMASTKESMLRVLNGLLESRFFQNIKKDIDILGHWDRKEIVSFALWAKDARMIKLYCGIILTKLRDACFQRKNTKKLLVVDDASVMASPTKRDTEVNIALSLLIDSITLWRQMGFSVIFATQSKKLLSTTLIENCKYGIFGKIGGFEMIADYMGIDTTTGIDKVIKNLSVDPKRHIKEWVFLHEDKINFDTFFHLNPIVKHHFTG